ncbi:MAG: FAD-dependent oxidoreductase [Ilumatobacter sp.]|uniref:NAD(P)/FAD-dependent oxidoreductase n=1 Tax=Ilumatobacter sp. TaxID=1967498 RepID=UPI00329A1F7D
MKVVIVGAGMAGLVAAHELVAAGVDVVVVDKGRSVGGRLATRRIGDARLDHGAQFFTVRTPAFQRRVDDWLDRGLLDVWNHGFDPDATDGHPRFVATGGMNSLAKDLATGLDGTSCTIETSTMAFTVRRTSTPSDDPAPPWEVVIDDATVRAGDAVILTCPLPQSLALLVDSDVEMDSTLMRTEYDRTICLLATLDGPAALPSTGAVQGGDEVFGFIGDNRSKGVSPVDAITFHADPEWSEAHWDDDAEDLLELLVHEARRWLGDASIVESQVKKWRLAAPRSIWPDPCWTSADGTIVMAGDAFAGPKVEGAHNSGLAAAHALLS